MHEKLVRQLRNSDHCGGCPYNEDCNEFDSCLMDLLAADAIEDMSKRITRQEKELQEKDKYIEDEEYLFGEDWQNEYNLESEQDVIKMARRAASKIIMRIHPKDTSGELLFYFVKSLQKISNLAAYRRPNKHRFVVIEEDEYKKLKDGESKTHIHSDDVLTKEQTDTLYELAKTPIDIDEKIIDKFNSIGCTSFTLTSEQIKELLEKQKDESE